MAELSQGKDFPESRNSDRWMVNVIAMPNGTHILYQFMATMPIGIWQEAAAVVFALYEK